MPLRRHSRARGSHQGNSSESVKTLQMSVLPTPGGPSNSRFAFGLPSELIPNSPLIRESS